MLPNRGLYVGNWTGTPRTDKCLSCGCDRFMAFGGLEGGAVRRYELKAVKCVVCNTLEDRAPYQWICARDCQNPLCSSQIFFVWSQFNVRAGRTQCKDLECAACKLVQARN